MLRLVSAYGGTPSFESRRSLTAIAVSVVEAGVHTEHLSYAALCLQPVMHSYLGAFRNEP